MIVYLDSSVLARVYLSDEDGHAEAVALLADPEQALVTGTWSRIEVSGALVRAARVGRGDRLADDLLSLLDADLAEGGPVTVVEGPAEDVEARALDLVRRHGIRAMDAWHLATASITLPELAEPGEVQGFASRDRARADVAVLLGLRAL